MKVLVAIGVDPLKLDVVVEQTDPDVTYVFDPDSILEGTKFYDSGPVIFTRAILSDAELKLWLSQFGADCEITVVSE